MTAATANDTGHRPRIETARLTLRPPERADFDACARFLASDRSAFVGGPVTETKDAWRAFSAIAGHWWLHGYGWFMVTRTATGEVVGCIGLHHPPYHADLELGWVLYSATGEGMATEAASAVRDWGRRTLGPAPLVSYIDTENAASQAVARRLGATTDGTRAEHDPACEVWRHPEAAR